LFGADHALEPGVYKACLENF